MPETQKIPRFADPQHMLRDLAEHIASHLLDACSNVEGRCFEDDSVLSRWEADQVEDWCDSCKAAWHAQHAADLLNDL